MRAIIIDDKDAKALLDKLKLESLENYCTRTSEIYGISPEARKAFLEEVHRRFHYVVCTWLQQQGASTV